MPPPTPTGHHARIALVEHLLSSGALDTLFPLLCTISPQGGNDYPYSTKEGPGSWGSSLLGITVNGVDD